VYGGITSLVTWFGFCEYFRLEHENSVNETNWLDGVDWWSGHDTNVFFRRYYYLGKNRKYKS
jgi:hypothetical protein